MATSIRDRILASIEIDADGCWIWQKALHEHGYGLSHIRAGSRWKTAKAHRVSYETFVGPIPEGLQIDHLCRVRACVNPKHLEPVTSRVNTLRGQNRAAENARKTHCKRGHPFDLVNTYSKGPGKRECRTCQSVLRRRWREKQRTAAA